MDDRVHSVHASHDLAHQLNRDVQEDGSHKEKYPDNYDHRADVLLDDVVVSLVGLGVRVLIFAGFIVILVPE